MAGIYAIAAITQTLKGVLLDARPTDLQTAPIEIYQTSDYQKTKPLPVGVSILLYRVSVSSQQRGITMQLDGTRRAPALPVDLHYLLTVWGEPTTQHYLLGWLMRLMEDSSHIDARTLNHFASQHTFEEDETLTLVNEPLALADLSSLWEMLKPSAQLSVGYLARMVYIESSQFEPDHAPVQTRVYDIAQVKR